MSNVKTIDLGGKQYAQVVDRLKIFREECPNGLVETKPDIIDNGKQIVFKARILKDKAKPESGEGTGHAYGENKGTKAFEKLETIAVGRALAMLGYMASGEIASSDEMEEFYAYKEQKIEELIDSFNSAKTLDELKDLFINAGNLIADKRVVEAKDKRKSELTEKNNENN